MRKKHQFFFFPGGPKSLAEEATTRNNPHLEDQDLLHMK